MESNITRLKHGTEKDYKAEYYRLLEQNNQLNSRLTELENEREKTRKREHVLRKLKSRLDRKTEMMALRSEALLTVETVPAYETIKKKNAYADIFGVIKQARWHLHAATTQFNLSVRKRRLVKGKSKSLTAFSNANPRFLTVMRICMFRYSTKQPLTTATIIADAEEHMIDKATVYRFLRESQTEGALIKTDHGVYEFSEKLKQDYWQNLVQVVFAKETIHFVSVLRRIYAMFDLKMMATADFDLAHNHGFGFKPHREPETTYSSFIEMLSNFDFPADS